MGCGLYVAVYHMCCQSVGFSLVVLASLTSKEITLTFQILKIQAICELEAQINTSIKHHKEFLIWVPPCTNANSTLSYNILPIFIFSLFLFVGCPLNVGAIIHSILFEG